VWALEEQRKRDSEVNKASSWEKCLDWQGRPEAETVVRRLRDNPKSLGLVSDEPEVLRDLLRPFRVDDESLMAIITAARLTE